MKRILLIAVAISLLPACATSPTGRSQFMLISPESAIVQSEQAYLSTTGEFSKEDKLVTDPAITSRVAEITGALVTVAVENTLPPQTGTGASPLSMTRKQSMPGAWLAGVWRFTPAYLINCN